MSARQGSSLRSALLGIAAEYRGDPDAYARRFLRCQLTPQQSQILRLLDTPPYRVLVPSATNVGKTFAAAVRASYFFDTHVPSVVLATAPTKVSVADLLFKELRRIRPTLDGFAPKDTRLQYAIDHYVHGFTAAKADAFQGRHEEYQGIVFDEATGVDIEFWKRANTMHGRRLGHWWLATYNPNDISSYVYGIEDGDDPWHVVRLSALDHPNIIAALRGEVAPIPGAVQIEEVIGRMRVECRQVDKNEYEPDMDFEFPVVIGGPLKLWRPITPEFEAQILGRWPIAGNESIWTPAVYEQSRNRQMGITDEWGIAVGCDVARFGADKTTIAVRKGPVLFHLEALSGNNSKQTADCIKVILAAVVSTQSAAKCVPVYVDGTGGYGSGVIDHAEGYNFIDVNSSEKSPDPRFPNVRSYLWWNLRHIADNAVCDFSRLPAGESAALKRELCSPRYHLDAKGRRVVEVKSQIRQRLGSSPDRADAVNLCYYLGV